MVPGYAGANSVYRALMSRRGRPFEIIHTDSDLIVVSKPSGLLTVPIRASRAPSLLSLLNEFLGRQKVSAHIVHRIDRYTSGLVVFAKHPKARHELVRQFLEHSPVRTYLAVVVGSLSKDEGVLEHYMKRTDAGFRQSCKARRFPGSSQARLSFRVLERLKRCSVVEVQLDTGFKNQIRAQFAEIGHPLVGEQQYCRKDPRFGKFDHQALHAWKLSFSHPTTKRELHFTAPLPGDLHALLKREGSALMANSEQPTRRRQHPPSRGHSKGER